MNAIKIFAFISALFAAQSAMATPVIVDSTGFVTSNVFGDMGPPGDKGVSIQESKLGKFEGLFTFSISAPAHANGATTGSALYSGSVQVVGVQVQGVNLFDSSFHTYGIQSTTTNTGPDSFSYSGLAAGNYTLYVLANVVSTNAFSVVLQTTASAVPEPEAYAMMLAGLGLVGFAARRKMSA